MSARTKLLLALYICDTTLSLDLLTDVLLAEGKKLIQYVKGKVVPDA
jgi:hypothetical protein